MVKQFSILIATLFTLIFPQLAHAATSVSVNFTRETGVGPFTGTGPGNDAGPNDSIIRTNDIISYKFEVLVGGGDATNIVLNMSVAPGLILSLPAFCRENGVSPPSTISGSSAAGYSVVCNVGDVGEGSQVLYSLPAKVAPDRAHNTTVSMLTASVRSDQTPQESFPGSTDTVSARPKLDLVKNGHTRLIGRRPGPSGEDGVVYVFPIIVNAEGEAKGNELVTAPISFTDDLSGVSPNARLFEGWSGAPSSACGPNYGISGYHLWSQIPRGNTQISDGGPGGAGAGPAERSVWNSGDIQCSPTTTGGATTTVTITGADLTGTHQPTRSANNGGLDASKTYLVAGNMIVWIPMQDINDAGNQLSVNNVYGTLDAVSISGQQNIDPDTSNNTRSFIAQDGGGGRYFYNHKDHNSFSLLPGQTSRRSGDGYILPQQVFATRHYQYNRNWLTKTPYNNFSFCTTFDNTTQTIREITPGQGAKIHYSGTYEGGQDPYVIEYGTGGFGATEFCDVSDDGWHTDIYSVPGGPGAITKVRAFTPQFSPPGGNSTQVLTSLIVRYEALDNPVGTYVAEWGAFRYDELNGGNWFAGTPYDETTGLGSYGDRLFLTKVSTRVSKDTVPSGDDQVLAGDQLTFKLQPSATTPIDPPGLTADVTLTDTLPVHYDYILGSASKAPASTVVNSDGTTTLVWEFPGTAINSAMTPVTYDIIVKPTTQDQTNAVNTVVASSPSDGSPENVRSDSYGILVLNPSGFSVYKTPTPELVSPNGDFGYDLTYANTGTSDFASVVMIDVLPDKTVTQNPPTVFEGDAQFVSVSGTSGETFEYSRTAPASIVEEPNDPSNQPGGSTVWCTGFTGGACPASPSEVTAIRATSPAFLQGQPTRTISLTMTATGNTAYNAYSNRFVARADGLAFAVTSPVATSRIRTADLSLSKTVTGPAAPAADTVTFTLTLNNDGPHDATDVSVRDTLPSGYAFISASASGAGTYDPVSGMWTVPFLPVDAAATLTIQAQVLPTGDYVAPAEIMGQGYADPDSQPGNMGAMPVEDDEAAASILAYLSGNIFIDNGVGGGTAHDGLLNGGEVPSNIGTLVVTASATGTQLTSTTVNADGTWFAILPDGYFGELTFTAIPNAGYRVMSEGTSTLPAVVNADGTDGTFQFTPTSASRYTNIDFGLIRKPVLVSDQVGAIAPGQVTQLSHSYTATTSASVAFSILNEVQNPAGGFASTIFHDTDCDGTSDQVVAPAIFVVAGQSICLNIRTQAGTGIGENSRYVYDLQAFTTYAGSNATEVATNSDSLTSGGAASGELVLRKLVRNITTGTPESTSNKGNIGDTLEYRIVMNNPANSALTNVKVNDHTPVYTMLAGPVTSPVVVAPGVVCTLQVPSTGNSAGYVGTLEWYCPGQFPPSTEGSLTFRVEIAP